MTKRRTAPLAGSPIVALAERAVAVGATEAVLVYLTEDGLRICTTTPDMDEVRTAGLLSMAIADLAASGED
jgi:hypothetical protein